MIYKRGCDKKGPEGTCSKCGERGSCGVYWYKFMWHGELVRESTKQGNDKVARQMEAAHRTRLAKEHDERQVKAERLGCPVGQLARCSECDKWYDGNHSVQAGDGQFLCSGACRALWERKAQVVPTLRTFCEQRFEAWAKASFERTCRNNWYWFRAGIRRLTSYEPLANCKLDGITNEKVSGFAAHEQTRLQNRGKGEDENRRGLAVSSINSTVRVLRRILRLANEWGVVEQTPKLGLLPGERHRERVISHEEEALYLAAAPALLADVAVVLAGTGLRPDECYRLQWQDITWSNGRNGTLLVKCGKTAAARRVIPMTPPVRAALEERWQRAGRPQNGWIWPAPTQSGHINHASLKKQHARTFRTINSGETKNGNGNTPAKKNQPPRIRPFVLYAFRHTFLTRLGESGCDAWTLARIAGHSSIAISSRYVHPSEDVVLDAMARLGGHKSGHNAESEKLSERERSKEIVDLKGSEWCARRDSNSRPIAPEAIALSI
jgi:integrase